MKKWILPLLSVAILWSTRPSSAQPGPAHLSVPAGPQSVFLRSVAGFGGSCDWQMIKAGQADGGGEAISLPGYATKGWMDAQVPGTVLNSLVRDGVYPDPYFADNNRLSSHLIPDLADSGSAFYTYWFRTSFTIPASLTGKRLWLKFHGINYRCEIWLNGTKLGDIAGMFITHTFDITALSRRTQQNVLAVKVFPVEDPGANGAPKRKGAGAVGEGHNGGDGLIGRNVTMLMTVGWDFTFPDGVRDRNTGIWRDIELFSTGDVRLSHAYVSTRLPLPDTSYSEQTISVEASNASDYAVTGTLRGRIAGTGIRFQKPVSLAPHENRQIVFRPAGFPQLQMHHPILWWPVHKGSQHLYELTLDFQDASGTSQQLRTRFGVREITSDTHTPDSSRRFLVNGVPVFIRGANWIPEAMCRNTETRTHAELKYIHQAGINFLRLWGGGITESDYFYSLCDQYGIMVWSEFWITGNTVFPVDTTLYRANLASTIKRIRSHASIAYYVSANESTELPGSGKLIHSLDSATGYQRESECCGVHDGSPYKYVNPMQYFENTASKRGSRVDGFNPEYGSPCLPILSSLKRMIPEKDLWPINTRVWNYMDGGGFHLMSTRYREAVEAFGFPSSIGEYARKAQFVGAMNYRAIWEVWDYNKFGYGDRFCSGLLFWYINSAEPQVASRLYDWYLEPTAALYYTQNALEPLHPQFDYLKSTVSVYNDYRKAFHHYTLSADVYNLRSERVSHQETTVDIPADGVVTDALKMSFPDSISSVHFIKLILRDTRGKVVGNSFYWRSKDVYQGPWTMTGPATGGFEAINQLPKVKLRLQASCRPDGIHLTVSNPSGSLSFFTQVSLQNPRGQSVRPAYYSDNFFNLLPGESKNLTVSWDPGASLSDTLRVVVDGFNAPAVSWEIALPASGGSR